MSIDHDAICDDRRGVAAVEFALILPTLLLTIALIVDLGYAFHMRLLLVKGVAAGTYYAAGHAGDLSSSNAVSIAQTISNLVQGVTSVGVNVTVLTNGVAGTANADRFYCLNGGLGSMATTGLSSKTCADATTSGKFVTVQATQSYVPVFPVITSRVAYLAVGETITVRVR